MPKRQEALDLLVEQMKLLAAQGLSINVICQRLIPASLAAIHAGCRMSEIEEVLLRTFTNLVDEGELD
ncbi:MAG: hypothetical protein WC243_03825 [Patescibacteria group bacterium]|jgi:hypothetical protein